MFPELRQSLSEPQITLQKTCASFPFQYSIGLTAQSSVDLHLVYRIYADDLDGIPDPDGNKDILLFVFRHNCSVTAATSFSSGLVDLPPPFCCTDPWSQGGIYAVVTAREFGNREITAVIEPACATLPVTLLSFTASRNNSTVSLKWETVTEENSKGFYILRNAGNNIWEVLGFVETKAINGSSNSRLDYTFTDLNNAKGIIQYRLKQVDINGKVAYSPIRAVRAGGQKGKTIVYPNPSNDGKVNVVFEDKDASRNVSLTDINGRVIKQWKNVLSNTLQIENLTYRFLYTAHH